MTSTFKVVTDCLYMPKYLIQLDEIFRVYNERSYCPSVCLPSEGEGDEDLDVANAECGEMTTCIHWLYLYPLATFVTVNPIFM